MKNFFQKNRAGFTLIELLLVIGIIAILAAIVIVAINPTKQLGDARNAQRRSDVNTILNAIWQYAIDNNGNMPCDTGAVQPCTGINKVDSVVRMLGTATAAGAAGCLAAGTTCADAVVGTHACLDLGLHLADKYVVQIPQDPRYGSSAATRYVVQTIAGNRVKVTACDLEGVTDTLSVSR